MEGHLFLTLLVILIPIFRSSAALDAISSAECLKTKSCFRNPDSCSGSDCTYFVSWKPVNVSGVLHIEFEVAGAVSSSGYIAIGFSNDKLMGNDDVIGCIASGPTIRQAHNPAYYNMFISAPSGHLITSAGSLLGGAFSASGFVSCRFRRRAKPVSNPTQLKDLSSPNKYFLIISRGNGVSGTGLGKHFGGGKTMSSGSFDFASLKPSSGGQAVVVLAKLHGGLMLLAWMMFSTIGVVMARSFKPVWADERWCGEKIWFQVHRCFQVLCLLCTVVGVIVIFVELGGYSKAKVLPAAAHPILGLIVTVLAITNPVMALFRPTPNAKKRPIFNWLHFGVGTLAQILAITSIFIGVKLDKVGAKFATAAYPFWIVLGHVIFCVVMELAFYINGNRLTKPVEKSDHPGENNPNITKGAATVHKVLLGIYVGGVSILSIALVALLFYE